MLARSLSYSTVSAKIGGSFWTVRFISGGVAVWLVIVFLVGANVSDDCPEEFPFLSLAILGGFTSEDTAVMRSVADYKAVCVVKGYGDACSSKGWCCCCFFGDGCSSKAEGCFFSLGHSFRMWGWLGERESLPCITL